MMSHQKNYGKIQIIQLNLKNIEKSQKECSLNLISEAIPIIFVFKVLRHI